MTPLELKVEIMRAAGLEDGQIARLASLKKRVENGQVDDLTIEHKRLTFLKFLHEAGRLSDNFPSSGETTIYMNGNGTIFSNGGIKK